MKSSPTTRAFMRDRELDRAAELRASSGRSRASTSASMMSRISGSADEAGLHDLGEAGEDLVARQRVEQVEVAQHRARRVERADEVLALGGVDAGLAADRGVDHAEHRRRHLDDVDAAQPGRGDEAGEVGRRSPAEADHGIRCG